MQKQILKTKDSSKYSKFILNQENFKNQIYLKQLNLTCQEIYIRYIEDLRFYKSLNIVLLNRLNKKLCDCKFYDILEQLLVNNLILNPNKIRPYYELLILYNNSNQKIKFERVKNEALEKFKWTKYGNQKFILNQIYQLEFID